MTAAVAVVAVVSVFGFGLPVLERSLAQPSIRLTNERPSLDRGSCAGFFLPGPPQYLTIAFTLYNSGEVDGLATVRFLLDDVYVLGVEGQYFVPAHGSTDGSLTARLNYCTGPNSFGVLIVSVVKA